MKLRLAVSTGFVLLAICATFAVIRHPIEPIAIKHSIEQFGTWAPVVFILFYIIATLLFIPGMPLSLAGGLLFGLFHGVLYNLIGTTLGACCAFILARHYGQHWIQKRAAKRIQMLMEG